MSFWMLYELTQSVAANVTTALLSKLLTRQFKTNPKVVALAFDYEDNPLSSVAEAANKASLEPLVITTSGFVKLIETARDAGLSLWDLEYNRVLDPDDSEEHDRVVRMIRDGASMEILKSFLAELRKKGIIVRKVSLLMEPPKAPTRARLSVQNNGVVSTTAGREVLEFADSPLSLLGSFSTGGAVT